MPTPTTTEYFASEYGVRSGVRVGFSAIVGLTGARLLWEGGSEEVGLYPMDGTDPDVPPETLDLPQGVEVSLEGNVLAACPDTPSLPVFEVQTVHEGEEMTERYVPDEPAEFRMRRAVVCAAVHRDPCPLKFDTGRRLYVHAPPSQPRTSDR